MIKYKMRDQVASIAATTTTTKTIIILFVVAASCIVTTETFPQATIGSNGMTTIELPVQTKFNCPEGDQCHCLNVFSEYEVQCPRFESHVSMHIRQPSYIHIQCISKNETAYQEIPQMNVGEISKLQLQGCPLPADRSFHSIADKFNATKIRTLIFQSFDYMGNMLFRRQHFGGFKDLQRLVLTDTAQTDLPSDLFDDLGTLNWLQLKSSREYLPRDIFSKLPNLQVIEVSMKLRTLEEGLFANQTKVRTLGLWGNQFQNLTKDSFEGLVTVLDLDLSSNNMDALTGDLFDPLINLENLNLNSNNFSSLPDGLLSNNNELFEFKMLHNRQPIKTLPSGLLSNKPKLNRVFLRADLQVIPEDLFSGSSNISQINMEYNRLEELPAKLFHDQRNLQELNLQHNKLTHLDDDLFQGTGALRVLHLSHNQLLNISANVFKHLDNLVTLHLDHNNLHTIGANAFPLALETLHLQFNRLTFKSKFVISGLDDEEISYSQSISGLSNLRFLRLDNNLIETLYMDWGINLLALEQLDLSNNHITYLSADNLQFLQQHLRVNLSNNQISLINLNELELIAGDSKSRSPVQIFLGSNPLNCNCAILSLVKLLKDDSKVRHYINFETSELMCSSPLNLRGKHVSTLDPYSLLCQLDSPDTTKKLCPGNCDCNVRPVDQAILVNCSNTGLAVVPALPEPKTIGMKHIELDLSYNYINELPDTSKAIGYNGVSRLMLDHNNISRLYVENIPQHVQLMTLNHNNMQWMNETVLMQLNKTSSLEKLYLSDNPWNCDCDTIEFLIYVQSQFRKIGDFGKIMCTNGELLSKMTPGDFCSEENIAVILIAVIIALFSIFIAIAALLYIKYAQEIKVWLFAKGWLLWLVSEDELDEDKKYDAFISFSQRDEDLVAEYLVPELESGEYPYKLCIHFRDWIVGDVIADQVTRSVSESRKTIVILSPNFLQSVWGQAEFRQAHQTAMKEGLTRVILILYGDIGPVDKLDPELQSYLSTNTYLTWGDQWFWRKLRYALRHPISMRGTNKQTKGLTKNSIKTSVDDKLELIIPSPVTPTLTTPPAESANNSLITKLANGNGHLPNNNGYKPPVIMNGHGNGIIPGYNGSINGHVNGAFIINTNAKQSDV